MSIEVEFYETGHNCYKYGMYYNCFCKTLWTLNHIRILQMSHSQYAGDI